MLVDASNQCNVLSFQLGVNGIGASVASRSWNLKVKSTAVFPNLIWFAAPYDVLKIFGDTPR